MFLVFAIACAIVGASAFFVLSGAAGSVMSGYLASLRRLPVLDLQCAPLRLAAGRGTLWFFAFCAPWAGSWGGAVAAAIAACAIALAMIVTATVRGKARSLG
jgi:hypothetical protein